MSKIDKQYFDAVKALIMHEFYGKDYFAYSAWDSQDNESYDNFFFIFLLSKT